MNNWGIEIASMSYVTFKHIKGTDLYLSRQYLMHLRSVHLHDSLGPQGEGKELGHLFLRISPICTEETPAQLEQNNTMIY